MATQTGSQAVERASALLSLIVESGTPRTFSSLVDELGLAKSTTSRLLQALERSGWCTATGPERSVRARCSPCTPPRPSALHDLSELARPTMEHLSQVSRETVNLAVPRGGQVVQIDQVDGQYLIGAVNWVGVDVPAHCTALGKVLYAYGTLPLPLGNLERRTPHSPVDRAQFDHALVEVRRRGWAASLDELELGLAAVGAPVRTVDGTVVAAVDLGPTNHREYGIPSSAISWSPSSAACRRCWATNQLRRRGRHDGPRGNPARALRRDPRR
jgi:DNA-binding IclR family transcriptional regulator